MKPNTEQKGLHHPVWIYFSVTLPQVIMLLLFLQGYCLIHKEMSRDNFLNYSLIMGISIFNAGIFTVWGIILVKLKKNLTVLTHIISLISQISFLWLSVYCLGKAVPANVNDFIFPVFRYFGYQFTFFMPAIFHALLGISNFTFRAHKVRDFLITLAGLVGIPLLFYMLANISCFERLLNSLPFFILILVIVSLSAIFIICLLRLLATLFVFLESRGDLSQFMLAFTAGIVLPIAGLLLNIKIPFPADFQDWRVYAMTILNGVILSIPLFKGKKLGILLFSGKAVLYPFTLYFFLVFLPFLPLSLFAIIAAGCGFLMLSPTALFYIHTKRIVNDFLNLSQYYSYKVLFAVLIASVLVIPSAISINALLDKKEIFKAVAFVYASDYLEENPNIYKHLPRIKKSLEYLYSFKHGIEMPYLTLYYQWLVFDNLVLPDKKIIDIYKKLFGEKLELDDKMFSPRWPFSDSRKMRISNPEAREDDNIKIQSIKHEITDKTGGISKCRMTIELKNTGEQFNTEFVTDLQIPEGVFVCGYSLRIKDEDVPARIFEKKSALWIYEKITSENRDPGLLYYTSPYKLKLRVFPFSPGETRFTSIDFLFPGKIRPMVSIGMETVVFEPMEEKSAVKEQLQDNKDYSVFSRYEIQDLPSIKREPVIHFILDYSKNAQKHFSRYPVLINDIGEKLNLDKCCISLANLNCHRILEFKKNREAHSFLKGIPEQFLCEGGFHPGTGCQKGNIVMAQK